MESSPLLPPPHHPAIFTASIRYFLRCQHKVINVTGGLVSTTHPAGLTHTSLLHETPFSQSKGEEEPDKEGERREGWRRARLIDVALYCDLLDPVPPAVRAWEEWPWQPPAA